MWRTSRILLWCVAYSESMPPAYDEPRKMYDPVDYLLDYILNYPVEVCIDLVLFSWGYSCNSRTVLKCKSQSPAILICMLYL